MSKITYLYVDAINSHTRNNLVVLLIKTDGYFCSNLLQITIMYRESYGIQVSIYIM